MKYEFVLQKYHREIMQREEEKKSTEKYPSELGSTVGVIKAILHLPNQPSNIDNSECVGKRDENFERKHMRILLKTL